MSNMGRRPPARGAIPAMAQGFRLPQLPTVPHDPKVPPGLPSTPQPADPAREIKLFEAFEVPVDATEFTVLTFEKQWRGVDVYLTPNQALATVVAGGGFVRVKIYGIAENTGRSLVASGVFSPEVIPGGGAPVKGVWVAGARALAQRFEVTCILHGALVTPPDPLVMMGVASNECVEVPDDIGNVQLHHFPLGASACMPANGAVAVPQDEFLVTGVHVTNTTSGGGAAFRSLQLHDQSTVAACVGALPRTEIVLGPGQTIAINRPMGRFSRNGLVAFVSTTPIVATAGAGANDLVYTVFGK